MSCSCAGPPAPPGRHSGRGPGPARVQKAAPGAAAARPERPPDPPGTGWLPHRPGPAPPNHPTTTAASTSTSHPPCVAALWTHSARSPEDHQGGRLGCRVGAVITPQLPPPVLADRPYPVTVPESGGSSRSVVPREAVGMLPGAQPSTSSKQRAAREVGRPSPSSWNLMVARLNWVRCASSITEMPSASRNSMRAFASRSDSSLMTKAFRITNARSVQTSSNPRPLLTPV